MSQTNWEADKMLDVYIYDYFMKRKLHNTAKAFQAEGKVSSDPVAIDAPGGFLFEWWSVFWDIFIARTNERHSEAAASYIESQMIKARELQQQQHPKPQQHQQVHIQQLMLQRHAQQHQQQNHQQHQNQQQQQTQQQRRDNNPLLNGTSSGIVGNDSHMRQNAATANAMATKMYEDRLKLPLQRDSMDDTAMKPRLGDPMGQMVDPSQASLMKTSGVGGQPPGQMLPGTPGSLPGNLQQAQIRSQPPLSVSGQEKSEMGSMMNARANGPEGSVVGVHGSSQGSGNLTLKGWPLTGGLEQFRSGILQPQKSLMSSSQPFNQHQLQQQLLLQAQRNLMSPPANDLEVRKLRMFLGNQNVGLGKDGSLNAVGEVVPNVGSPMQHGVPPLQSNDPDMLIKLQQQQQLLNNSQQAQNYPQHMLPNQQSQSSSHILQQQDKMIGTGNVNVESSTANTFPGNEQTSKNPIGRKRKQPASSSGPANSSGTANATGPSPSSPSSPSTHTDVMSMPKLPPGGGTSKSMLMYGSTDGMASLTSAPGQLANMDRLVDDGILEENVDSFLSPDGADPDDRTSHSADISKGLNFTEIRRITASASKVECCHFSSDGKLLATGGQDKKAVLWCTDSFTMKSALDEHSQLITDVRFSPSMLRLATSSGDRSVRVWEADNPGYSLRNFVGHSAPVMSLDFNPSNEDVICSCDDNGEIRYWGIKNGSCLKVFKGGATQVRFQPCSGRILAAAMHNYVSIIDAESLVPRFKLMGHKNPVRSVCWHPSGELAATVSDEVVKVWNLSSGHKGELVHELNCTGNRFHTCVFHPGYNELLVIGCYMTLELWNMADNKTMTLQAHEKLVSSLAVSHVTGMVASASHDKCVKLWK